MLEQLVLHGIPIGCCTRCSASCRLVSIRHWHWIEMTWLWGDRVINPEIYNVSFSVTTALLWLRYVQKEVVEGVGWRRAGVKMGKWLGSHFCFLGFILGASPVQGEARAPYKGLCNKCHFFKFFFFFKASFNHFNPWLTESQSDVSLLWLGNFLMALCTDGACCLDQRSPCP